MNHCICAAAPDANLVSGLVCNLISKCNAEFSNVVILDVDQPTAEDAISALAHYNQVDKGKEKH